MLKILSKKNVTNSSGFVEMGSENLDDDYGKQKKYGGKRGELIIFLFKSGGYSITYFLGRSEGGF